MIQSLIIDSNENKFIEFFQPTEHLCLCFNDKYSKGKYQNISRDGLVHLSESTLEYINTKLKKLTFSGFSKGHFKKYLTFRNIHYELLEIMKYYDIIEEKLDFSNLTVTLEKTNTLGKIILQNIK